ncbi:LysR family transcriptional regulator [Duganella sp. BJB1802]|uniref:LysR family transcriptional regulator n=1 Tax=Duganella sp. BJB1802 TaxID=2744575 RepID=UPI001594A8E3|nr:LysR family transcriptional regulator [Duganella sp. BJB1802]NVD74356.1 LysR family transcriptional regulator [Duganella sp. BJB1802]
MKIDLADLTAFLAVANAKGFREGARASGLSASGLSEAVRRLEAQVGVRLLHRTTRSVATTEAGERLRTRLGAALTEVEAALDAVNDYRGRPSGTLKLNVPISGARLILPAIVSRFLAAYPEIRLDITADDNFVNVLEAGCDAGIRYDERLEQDMIAVPIGPRIQRFAAAAAPSYLDRRGRPGHPRDLLQHDCLRLRFAGRAMPPWEFTRDDETVQIDAEGPLHVQGGAIADLLVEAAIGGSGIVYLFEDWLRPHLDSGALVPVLEPWWLAFSGPFLYYPGRRLVPEPLRAFIDFIREADQGRQ